MSVYYENEETLKKYYDELSKEQMELTKISETNYIGKINIQSDNEYVLFAIPYDEGWRTTVNGEDKEIIRVQDELMAVKVNPGENEINIKFVPKGFYLGMAISVTGIVIFVSIEFIKYFKFKHK